MAKKYKELAVLWHCNQCGAYNLHSLDETDFECIYCAYTYYALAQAHIIKE